MGSRLTLTEDEAVTLAVMLGGEFTEYNGGLAPKSHKNSIRWTCRLKGDTRQSTKRYGTRHKAAMAFVQYMHGIMESSDAT